MHGGSDERRVRQLGRLRMHAGLRTSHRERLQGECRETLLRGRLGRCQRRPVRVGLSPRLWRPIWSWRQGVVTERIASALKSRRLYPRVWRPERPLRHGRNGPVRLGTSRSSPRRIPVRDEKYGEDRGAHRGEYYEDDNEDQNAICVELTLDKRLPCMSDRRF